MSPTREIKIELRASKHIYPGEQMILRLKYDLLYQLLYLYDALGMTLPNPTLNQYVIQYPEIWEKYSFLWSDIKNMRLSTNEKASEEKYLNMSRSLTRSSPRIK